MGGNIGLDVLNVKVAFGLKKCMLVAHQPTPPASSFSSPHTCINTTNIVIGIQKPKYGRFKALMPFSTFAYSSYISF